MRLLLGLGFIWFAVLLAPFARVDDGDPPSPPPASADPATWPTPNADPNWYYYDLGPFDPAAYRPVSIAEIVADPFQFDGQLVVVQGTLGAGARPMPDCVTRPPSRTPTVEPGFIPTRTAAWLSDPSGDLGILVWGKSGDSFGGQDELAAGIGEQIELRGILRASHQSPPCRPEQLQASAYLAIQRTDPAIAFKVAAQDLKNQRSLPPSGQSPAPGVSP